MNYATANPADTADISTVDLDGKVLADGANVRIPNYVSGVGSMTLTIDRAHPEWGLYALTEDDTVCGAAQGLPSRYYVRTSTYAQVGAAFDPATVVQQTAVCTQIPIAELFDLKLSEISRQDAIVRYSTADTPLQENWWIVVNQEARSEFYSIASALAGRTQEIVTGARLAANWYPNGGDKAPRMAVLNALTGITRREAPSEAQYLQIVEHIAIHTNECGNATFSASNQAAVLYDDGAGDWTALAELDPASPVFEYPPYIPLP